MCRMTRATPFITPSRSSLPNGRRSSTPSSAKFPSASWTCRIGTNLLSRKRVQRRKAQRHEGTKEEEDNCKLQNANCDSTGSSKSKVKLNFPLGPLHCTLNPEPWTLLLSP